MAKRGRGISIQYLLYTNLTLAPLVHESGWRLEVGGFDPGWEEASLVGLVPEVLVEVGVRDLLQGLHVVHRDQVAVQVHELYTSLKAG